MSDTEPTPDEAEQKAKTWWDNWASYFQEEYGEESIPVGVSFGHSAPLGDDLGLPGELDGKKAIELGCGGQFEIGVSKRVGDVTGTDLSEEQLAYARSLTGDHIESIREALL